MKTITLGNYTISIGTVSQNRLYNLITFSLDVRRDGAYLQANIFRKPFLFSVYRTKREYNRVAI